MILSCKSKIPEIINNSKAELLKDWLQEQKAAGIRNDLIKQRELREDCREFLDLLAESVQQCNLTDIQSSEWGGVRDMLASISRDRSHKGFTPSETASFIFSLKQPLFSHLRQKLARDSETLLEEILSVTILLDKLGLWTTELYQKAREEVIIRQQEELLELILLTVTSETFQKSSTTCPALLMLNKVVSHIALRKIPKAPLKSLGIS